MNPGGCVALWMMICTRFASISEEGGRDIQDVRDVRERREYDDRGADNSASFYLRRRGWCALTRCGGFVIILHAKRTE